MPIRPKDKSIDEMKKDVISNSVAERGYKKGGMAMVMKDGKKIPAFAAKKGGMTKKMNMGGMAYAKGGSASSRADGIAVKGKTKGKMLAKGGKTC